MSDFSTGIQKEQKDLRKRNLISNLIVILWISSIGLSMVAYSMAQGVMVEGELGHLRSYLLQYSNVMLVYLISFITGFALSALIFYAIMTSGTKFKLYVLGGLFFLISGIFDLASSYYVLMLRNRMIDLAERVPLLTIDEVEQFINTMNYDFAAKINLLNTWSIVTIGLAFVFFGLNSIILSGKIKTEIENYLRTREPIEQETGEALVIYGQRKGRIDEAASNIKNAGIFYLISGLCDVAILIPGFEGLATFGFLLFLIGLYYERKGFKKLQESGAPMPPSFSEIFG